MSLSQKLTAVAELIVQIAKEMDEQKPTASLPIAFDESYYLAQNPDVANAVRSGSFSSGYDHYVKHGKAEGRLPTAQVASVPPPANPNQLLNGARALSNGFRVDPVVPTGTYGTVTLPKTGHVLSVPRLDLQETFVGYCIRVLDQATDGKGDEYKNGLGGLFLGYPGVNPDGSNWPERADAYFNIKAYMTPEQKEQEARSAQQWAEWDKTFIESRKPKPKPEAPKPEVTIPEKPTDGEIINL
jgi:hypothetical protein